MEQVSENEVENQPSNDAESPSISSEKDEVAAELPPSECPKTEIDPTENPDTFRVQHPDENLDGLPPQKEELVQAPEWCVIQAGESIPLKGYNFKLVGYAKDTFDLILRCVGPTGKTLKERAELAKKNAKRR